MTKILIYDTEIINCIPDRNNPPLPHCNYCQGWNDHKNMGISVIGTWRNYLCWNLNGKYEAFTNPTNQMSEVSTLPPFRKFKAIASHADIIVGFNSLAFDDKLLKANGINVTTDFDLLAKVRIAAGMPPYYVRGVTRAGYSLERLAYANLGKGKTGTGELAPVLWQQGKQEEVIKYCLNDVRLLRTLYFRFIRGKLYDPTNGYPLGTTALNPVLCFPKEPLIKDLIIRACGGIRCNPMMDSAGWRKYVLTDEQYQYYEWLVERPESEDDELPF